MVFLAFDFGYKRIGVAVGQLLTQTASPLPIIEAKQGIPNWSTIHALIQEWRPEGLVVGVPTCIDDSEQYTTKAAKKFAAELSSRYALAVHLVDERLTTKEARSRLFALGGYRKIKQTAVDSIAACLILEQWLQTQFS